MQDEGVIYVAGRPLLRCTRLPECVRLQNELYCVGWGVKLYSLIQTPAKAAGQCHRHYLGAESSWAIMLMYVSTPHFFWSFYMWGALPAWSVLDILHVSVITVLVIMC